MRMALRVKFVRNNSWGNCKIQPPIVRRWMMRILAAVLMQFSSGTTPAQPSAPVISARARAAIIPLADHHEHMLGPTALPVLEPRLPTVELPKELETLLAARGRLYGNVKAPSDLDIYVDAPQAISWAEPSRWVRGREAMREVLSSVVSQPYDFRPNAYQVDGAVGFIAGVVVVGTGANAPAALDFLLGISKGGDGVWRIATESVTIKSPPRYPGPITAEKVVGELDDAGIQRAMILSVAYWLNAGRFPNPADEMTKEYQAVRNENDWVAAQVARYPTRLVMACSANVLRAYAIRELERCSHFGQATAFKLHFADAQVDLRNTEHLEKVRHFFAAANRLRIPLIVHFAPRFRYGRDYVDLFLDRVMSQAPDIRVQIAHLGGDGPGIDYPEGTAAFAEVMAKRDPRARKLYFDVAGLVTSKMQPQAATAFVDVLRRIGLQHILYGSDGQLPNKPTAEHWTQVRRKLPLTDAELRIIATNVAPYLEPKVEAHGSRGAKS